MASIPAVQGNVHLLNPDVQVEEVYIPKHTQSIFEAENLISKRQSEKRHRLFNAPLGVVSGAVAAGTPWVASLSPVFSDQLPHGPVAAVAAGLGGIVIAAFGVHRSLVHNSRIEPIERDLKRVAARYFDETRGTYEIPSRVTAREIADQKAGIFKGPVRIIGDLVDNICGTPLRSARSAAALAAARKRGETIEP